MLQVLQPIHFWKDLEKIFPKMYGLLHHFRDNRQKHQHRRLNSYRGDILTALNEINGREIAIRPLVTQQV